MPIRRRDALGLLGAAALAHPALIRSALIHPALAQAPAPAQPAGLTEVARFPQQVTGVAVSPRGRIFINFPRWEKDVDVSVAELMQDGTLRPYPNAQWNAWRNLKPLTPGDHFVCVQSVTVDAKGFLWIVDPAAPGNEFLIPGGPKLVKVDLSTDKVVQVIPFGPDVAPQGTYLNDVRVSPDGRVAYLTDSGTRGAILAVDLRSGRVRRLLDGHSSTQPESGVVVHADGRELRRPDNRGPSFAADGIALDPTGRYLYWQALVGKTLYRIATTALLDARLTTAQLSSRVEKLGPTNIADGYWMDAKGRLFITSPEDDSVKLRRPDGSLQIVVQDPRLHWPDSMAEGPDGALYVTASCIQDMSQWHEKGPEPKQPWALYRFAPPS